MTGHPQEIDEFVRLINEGRVEWIAMPSGAGADVQYSASNNLTNDAWLFRFPATRDNERRLSEALSQRDDVRVEYGGPDR